MKAYLISDVHPRNAEEFEAYRTRAAESIAKYGGRYLTRGGKIERLEGDWNPQIIVLVEFPSTEHAKAWYNSPEYTQALQFRDRALDRNLILVDG